MNPLYYAACNVLSLLKGDPGEWTFASVGRILHFTHWRLDGYVVTAEMHERLLENADASANYLRIVSMRKVEKDRGLTS